MMFTALGLGVCDRSSRVDLEDAVTRKTRGEVRLIGVDITDRTMLQPLEQQPGKAHERDLHLARRLRDGLPKVPDQDSVRSPVTAYWIGGGGERDASPRPSLDVA